MKRVLYDVLLIKLVVIKYIQQTQPPLQINKIALNSLDDDSDTWMKSSWRTSYSIKPQNFSFQNRS